MAHPSLEDQGVIRAEDGIEVTETPPLQRQCFGVTSQSVEVASQMMGDAEDVAVSRIGPFPQRLHRALVDFVRFMEPPEQSQAEGDVAGGDQGALRAVPPEAFRHAQPAGRDFPL